MGVNGKLVIAVQDKYRRNLCHLRNFQIWLAYHQGKKSPNFIIFFVPWWFLTLFMRKLSLRDHAVNRKLPDAHRENIHNRQPLRVAGSGNVFLDFRAERRT